MAKHTFLLTLRTSARSRAALQLEVLALRHQLHVLQRTRPRQVRLAATDRWLWVVLSRLWTGWRTALVVVKPETVIASCAKTRPVRLRSLTVVELEQTAEPLTTFGLARSDHHRLGRDELVAETLVWPFVMVMVDEFSDGRPEMRFAEQHHSVQALGLDRLDEPFGERIGVSCRLHRQRAVRHKPFVLPIVSIRCVAGHFS